MKKYLTANEQRFVKIYATGSKTAKDAVIEAGYNVTNGNSAKSLASKVLKRERVQKALADAIEKEFPNAASMSANAIYNIIASEETSPTEKLKAIEVLIKVCGWKSQSETNQVTIKSSFALPEE